MTVLVQPGSGRIGTGTYPASYGYLVSHDTTAGESVTIATASASNRIDYVVAWIDKGVQASTSPAFVNNTNNVLKFTSVAGTPASSPSVPTSSQISTMIGAANPYIILAQIYVGASVTQITSANITDRRRMAGTGPGFNPVKFFVYRNAAGSFSANSTAKLPFDAKLYDTSNAFDATTNYRFTCATPGFYHFWANASAFGQTSSSVRLYKNGVDYLRGADMTTAANLQNVSLSTPPLQLVAGDYVEVFYFSASTVNLNVGNAPLWTWFGGELVSQV